MSGSFSISFCDMTRCCCTGTATMGDVDRAPYDVGVTMNPSTERGEGLALALGAGDVDCCWCAEEGGGVGVLLFFLVVPSGCAKGAGEGVDDTEPGRATTGAVAMSAARLSSSPTLAPFGSFCWRRGHCCGGAAAEGGEGSDDDDEAAVTVTATVGGDGAAVNMVDSNMVCRASGWATCACACVCVCVCVGWGNEERGSEGDRGVVSEKH